MADFFYDGMPNVNERLNQLYTAFAAGPYNGVPLTGGTMTGPLVAPKITAFSAGAAQPRVVLGATGTGEPAMFLTRWSGQAVDDSVWRVSNENEEFQIGYSRADRDAPQSFSKKISISPAGWLTVGPKTPATKHTISANVAPFGEILQVWRSGGTSPCASFNGSDGAGGWGNPSAVLYLGKNSTTSRSVNAAGTINASGADYAEYLIKGLLCGTIVPGQIVGIDADGHLTDKWDLAIAFAVKSTSPCMVGGDTWSAYLGPRPGDPTRQDEDTDEQWEIAQAAAQADQQAFDAALEHARQTVDRIAFAGQVPVNLRGAAPGQFIVPVQDGDGVGGLAIDEADITLRQYMRAIGRVIAIEDDGRARIIVKVA